MPRCQTYSDDFSVCKQDASKVLEKRTSENRSSRNASCNAAKAPTRLLSASNICNAIHASFKSFANQQFCHNLSAISWSTLETYPTELWGLDPASIPQIIPAQECWSTNPPTMRELYHSLLDPKFVSSLDMEQNSSNGRISHAIQQIGEPDAQYPEYLLNLILNINRDIRLELL